MTDQQQDHRVFVRIKSGTRTIFQFFHLAGQSDADILSYAKFTAKERGRQLPKNSRVEVLPAYRGMTQQLGFIG